mmetsp:Transcript_7859/g.12291  ORF Transcript_7859/g.12291 Transcript_7859/m.12291 type:complete len:219 (+) Transcript_7859:1964-2620(+)
MKGIISHFAPLSFWISCLTMLIGLTVMIQNIHFKLRKEPFVNCWSQRFSCTAGGRQLGLLGILVSTWSSIVRRERYTVGNVQTSHKVQRGQWCKGSTEHVSGSPHKDWCIDSIGNVPIIVVRLQTNSLFQVNTKTLQCLDGTHNTLRRSRCAGRKQKIHWIFAAASDKGGGAIAYCKWRPRGCNLIVIQIVFFLLFEFMIIILWSPNCHHDRIFFLLQ